MSLWYVYLIYLNNSIIITIRFNNDIWCILHDIPFGNMIESSWFQHLRRKNSSPWRKHIQTRWINIFQTIRTNIKIIWVDAVIFKLDEVEPIKLLTLFIFVFHALNDDNILFPATDNDVYIEAWSDVTWLHVKEDNKWWCIHMYITF